MFIFEKKKEKNKQIYLCEWKYKVHDAYLGFKEYDLILAKYG